jgi:hypothetical protein
VKFAKLLLGCCLWFTVLAPAAAQTRTIAVLWYSYAHPESYYRRMIERLGAVAHTLPKSAGYKWKISFYGPDWPQPRFERYDVLVIQSGEDLTRIRPRASGSSKSISAGSSNIAPQSRLHAAAAR